jgi:hypothetical protein
MRSLSPLPDLDDVSAMAATGRRSALMRARNEACEALRDATTRCQSSEIGDAAEPAQLAINAAQRLIDVAGLWGHVT